MYMYDRTLVSYDKGNKSSYTYLVNSDNLGSSSIIAAAIFAAMASTTVVVFGVCVIYRKKKDRKGA